jgi:hypothetical protein
MSSLHVPFQYLNFSEFYEIWCEMYALHCMLTIYLMLSSLPERISSSDTMMTGEQSVEKIWRAVIAA